MKYLFEHDFSARKLRMRNKLKKITQLRLEMSNLEFLYLLPFLRREDKKQVEKENLFVHQKIK
jgi:hypothetical protein